MRPPRILFLDDDHVLRIFSAVLSGKENEPATTGWFAPEPVDLAPLVRACAGLRSADGAVVSLAAEGGSAARDADIIVFRRGEINRALLQDHPRLRLVQRFGGRAEDIDLAALAERGVAMRWQSRPTLHYTAEHALLMMLALGKRLLKADEAVRQGPAADTPKPGADGVVYNWAGIPGAAGLHGSTLGLVGLGDVGSLVARLAVAFGMKVLYHKPRRAEVGEESALGVRYASLDELLGSSDYVSLHVPGNSATQGLAGVDFFRGMKQGACFVNTSRGMLVDEDALYQALASGRLAGAGLDVHAREPRPRGDRFASLPQVVLTPHLAGGARSGVLLEFAAMAENFRTAMQALS